MEKDVENGHAALLGRYAVMNEVVIAMLAAMPNRDAVLRLAMRNAQDLRDAAMEAEHSRSWMVGVDAGSGDTNAWLAGADMEIGSFQKLTALFAARKGA